MDEQHTWFEVFHLPTSNLIANPETEAEGREIVKRQCLGNDLDQSEFLLAWSDDRVEGSWQIIADGRKGEFDVFDEERDLSNPEGTTGDDVEPPGESIWRDEPVSRWEGTTDG